METFSLGGSRLYSPGLKPASVRVQPWASLLTSFFFICKVWIRIISTSIGLMYMVGFKGV